MSINNKKFVGLITGISGQDGSYLAELLLDKNYDVWGIIRRSSSMNTHRIDNIFSKLNLRYADITDSSSIFNVITEIKNNYPELERFEVYNLAAMSHVKISFEIPEYTAEVDAIGTLRILQVLKTCGISLDKIRFYQASTSEMYGKVSEIPQTENTPFYPRSPYGCAKLYSHWITRNFRESYNMFACSGILFNHESPRRGHNFVTRKITIGIGKILRGESEKIVLGNIDAMRDWGHAKDYVYGMWLMLQRDKPDDYILATGEQYSVRDFVEKAFKIANIDIDWKGDGIDEVGYNKSTGKELITVSEKYYRPCEVDILLGDSKKARNELGWKPKYDFDLLVEEMVNNDLF